MNKMRDVINSPSFLTNVNSEIGKVKDSMFPAVTLKSNSEPLVKIVTGSYEQLYEQLKKDEAEVESTKADSKTTELGSLLSQLPDCATTELGSLLSQLPDCATTELG